VEHPEATATETRDTAASARFERGIRNFAMLSLSCFWAP
jgi:hypothetical protein